MIPNWLLGKSKSKLQEILGGGGGGGTTYTAGEGIDITGHEISVDPVLLSDISDMNDAIPTKAALTQISNPNLLDNSWFTVNQRGQSSYGDNTTTGNIYSVDRWQRNKYDENGHKFTVGAIEIPYLKGDFFQAIEADVYHWRHVPYTLSAIVDGNLYSITFTPYDDGQTHMGTTAWGPLSLGLDALSWNIIEYWGGFQNQKNLVGINNYDASQDHVIRAIKLELGNVSTLAMDTAPDYATELLKCQRYFITLNTAVDLSSYNSYSNLYTAPSDGYVQFTSAASGSAMRTIYTYGNNTSAVTDPHVKHSTSANNKSYEIFIKKGLKVFIDGLQSGDTFEFYPLS